MRYSRSCSYECELDGSQCEEEEEEGMTLNVRRVRCESLEELMVNVVVVERELGCGLLIVEGGDRDDV